MKQILKTMAAAMIMCAMVGCGDKDDNHANNDTTDATSGATTHEDDMAKGRIGNGTYIEYDGSEISNAYGIDFDKDGTLEFRISDDRQYVSYVWSDGGNNIVNAEEQWDIIEPMEKGASVNSGCRWEGQGDAMLPYDMPEKFYVGFRFRLNNAIHYGWAKVKYEDGEVEWDKCAYNTKPGITAFCGED